MPQLYDRFIDQYQILDRENRPVEDTFSERMIWLDSPGCVLHAGDFQLPADLRIARVGS